MEVCRRSSWLLSLLGVILLAEALLGVQGEVEIDGPSETQCRPYIEKALRELETVGPLETGDADVGQSSEEVSTTDNISLDDKTSDEQRSADIFEDLNDTQESKETEAVTSSEVEREDTETKKEESSESRDEEDTEETAKEADNLNRAAGSQEVKSTEDVPEVVSAEQTLKDKSEESIDEEITTDEATSTSASVETVEDTASQEETERQTPSNLSSEDTESETQNITDTAESSEAEEDTQQKSGEANEVTDGSISEEAIDNQSTEEEPPQDEDDETGTENESATSTASSDEDNKSKDESNENESKKETSDEDEQQGNTEDALNQKQDDSGEDSQQIEPTISSGQKLESEEEDEKSKRSIEESEEDESNDKRADSESTKEDTESAETKETKSIEQTEGDANSSGNAESAETKEESADPSTSTVNQNFPDSKEESSKEETIEKETGKSGKSEETSNQDEQSESAEDSQNESNNITDSAENAPEEDLVIETDIPENLRPRDYVEQLLKLDREATKTEEIVDRVSEITLRELKRLYENAIKPLETLYKYRDLSNRHYGDAEIFSKPLILFMGPWSGGKSTIINYLLNIEYNDTALRTGAEPSPAYFNLLMHGEDEEVLDGTQLAADYTFSGLQKFGQGLEERLRGMKLPSKLLEKVNIAEIPGILEVRKQVSRVFPFNDACQWFIDRADIIFLVYDPSKLDVGPETEAILDQLKGREYQTRIVLNKADQIKPEELMRVQGALIWNISPLMSSPQPPVMYTTSLWSRPYENWAPVRLLQSQERAFLRDLRSAVDKRIDNKIASARRFAVRVRNHAKMVDCYLTTYYNHKSIFGNRKQVADTIIEHPQDYHIYEGLSTLTNISRYDLPDPDVYKDFFRLNPLYEFQQLSATCTYFRGCPINKLDVAIAYDFPELIGKHKRLVETALAESSQDQQAQGS